MSKIYCGKCKYYSRGVTMVSPLDNRCYAKSNWVDTPIYKRGEMLSTPQKKNINNNCSDFCEYCSIFRKLWENYLNQFKSFLKYLRKK